MLFKNKTASQDFDITQLPGTRIQSIKDILTNQWLTLLKIGFALLFFSLPILIHTFLTNITLYEINLAYELGNITKEYAALEIYRTTNTTNLILIPLLMFSGIGLSGVLRILRNLIWQNPLFFGSDFKQGVKSYGTHTVFSLLIIGLLNFIAQYVFRGSYFTSNTWSMNLAIVMMIVVIVFCFLIIFYVITQNMLYTLTWRGLYKNAFMYALRYFFKTILLALIFMPWLALFVSYDIGFIIIVLLLIVVILPVELLIVIEYAFDIYDQTINQLHFKEIYRKGLWSHE